jgi:hypothetical protein
MTNDLIDRLRSSSPRDVGPYSRSVALYPPAAQEVIARAEAHIGFQFPPLLRRLYLEVGNGGFGPGYGLFGVEGGHPAGVAKDEQTIDALYLTLRGDPEWWPEKLLPICDWGCAIWSCLDCRTDDGPVVHVEGASEGDCWAASLTLGPWLEAWLDGVDLMAEPFEPGPPRVGINPFTRKPSTFKTRGQPKRPWR